MKKLKGIFGKGKGGSSSHQTQQAGASHIPLGYDLKEKDLPKIHKAAWTGDIAKVKQLAKKDASSLDKENRTPLHLACVNGHTKIVQELLEWNVKKSMGDNEAKTPLMKAVECNQEECVRLLLEYRADVDVKDGENNTALHIAVKHSNTNMVSMLLEAGAQPNLKNRLKQTPLILSVLDPSKKDSITRLLLQNGAEVNAVDTSHRSALHHACMEDGINQVKLLLEYNANTALKDMKGWTAEDCAMMKANHACSQVVFDHNLKSRRVISGSVPSTPRNTDSVNLSRHTTPRDKSASEIEVSDFGMPQGHQDDAEDSDDQTISKQSLHDTRQDSWADDTDISAADDKLKKPKSSVRNNEADFNDDTDIEGDVFTDKAGAVKTSLTKHINIDSDEDEVNDIEDNKHINGSKAVSDSGRRRSPVKFRKVLVSTGDLQQKVRPMYSRTPTPDRDLARSPGATTPQQKSQQSKIPVKQRISGTSHTSVEEDFTDDEDNDDDSSPIQKSGRVSFSDHQQVRNISATDDDTDIEDDEEEVEPPKKRRIGNPDDNSSGGYTPTGYPFDPPESKPYSQDKMKEMMKELGIDEISDVSDPDDLDDSEPRDPTGGSQPTRPRGILKKTDSVGKPPSVQNRVETDAYLDSEEDDSYAQERDIIVEAEIHPATYSDHSPNSPIFKDEESDWDSTKQSLTEKGSHSIQIREEVESPEIDSDIENTLNPEKSVTSKTSQWDSSEEAFTPRTPRDSSQALRNQGLSPDIQTFEYEDESESRGHDHIQEVTTSFGVQKTVAQSPSVPTPEPHSDSSARRSRETPDPPTSSFSASMQRTVIAAQVDEPEESPRQENEDENSDWDSEDDVQSDDDVDGSTPVVGLSSPVVVGIDSINNTPRTPRDEKSEEESISEWEIEREKEREAARKQEEEMRILQEIEEEEERQKKWEEEERLRQLQIEREAQEELEREKNAVDNVESEESEFSDNPLPDSTRKHVESDHSQHASLRSQPSGGSERSQRSESLTSPRARELKKPPPKLVVSKFIAPVQSPTRDNKTPVTLGEIENESPGPDMFGDLIQPVQQQQHRFASQNKTPDLEVNNKDTGNMFKNTNGASEESDDDIEEINDEQADEIPDFTSEPDIPEYTDNRNKSDRIPEYSSGPVNQDGFNVELNNQVNVEYKKAKPLVFQDNFDKSDDDDDADDDEDEFEAGVNADMIIPQSMKKVEASIKPETVTRTELPVTEETRNQPTNGITEPSPSLPKTSPPVKAMSIQSDGQSADEDYLESHIHLTKSTGPSGLPDLSGTTGLYSSGLEVPWDDDGLSVTSTENGDISSSYRPENLPYGKDMLVNMNLTDSSSILKLQEHLREHRKQLEYERNQKMLLESRQKQVTKEKSDLQKMIDSLKYQKSALEQNKLDLEAKIRNLEYSVNDEEEKKKNAELLLKKTKEQLSKKEEQYTQEMEAKQRAELSMRNVQMELRSAQNTIKDLEEEKAELDRQLSNEKNARQLQEKINAEQQRLQQHIQEESLKTSSQRDDDSEEAHSALELADDDIKHARDQVDKYKNEITALKAELQRQRIRLTEENTLLSTENDKLQQRVDDLKNDIKDHEEALTQMTVQHNLHNSKLVSEATMLSDNLDKERVSREKVEAELDSLRTRLHATTVQLEKAQHARNDFERRLHDDREEWARQLDRKEQELASLKDKVQAHIQALNSTETKLNAVENELQISNTTLLERTNQYQQSQRDVQYYKTAHENYDLNNKHEKEQNAKYVAKIESLQDKLSNLQHENLNLKQQVESAQLLANDRAGVDLQDRLNTMISSLKSDHDKARASLEDKNNNLQDTITRLREEVRNSENRRSNLEQDIRRLNQEQNEIIRKLSMAEASLDVSSKARENLEQERLSLKMDIEKLQQRYNSAQEKTIEAQTRMGELVDKLDRTEQSRMLSSQQLADTSVTMQAFNVSKTELEENYQKIQVENVRLDAELKHEKQKTEMLQRDLADSQKVRSSLEALCSNLKSTNAHLEEKLGPDQLREVTASGEVANRNLILKEAEDHKGLWEQEVLSRSKLGLRIAQLERHKQETATQLEEEKRRTRKALEQKKLAETKLEAEQDKVTNLQKEVANLKAYLKVAKKRLKVLDTNENRLSNLHSAFDKERQAMEEMLVSVKSQLEHMKIQLQDETEEKDRLVQKNHQLEAELMTIKKLERSVQKIDRSKKKLEEEFRLYKSSVEADYTEKSSVEEAKKDIEARYRQELNRKLDEVNNYLEEQARTRQRLDLSRDEQESKIRNEKKKFEEECTDLRIKYEQAVAKLETKDLEAKRYRDLYESEMQWRMRLSEQVYRSTDKAFNFKNKLVAERQKNRLSGSMTNLSMNGHMLDISKINGSMTEDALSNRLRAELDRSIAKHLEAAPHDQIRPLVRSEDPVFGSSNFAKASADYIEVLKRKYCV